MMTTADIDPAILESIRANCERVMVKTDSGYHLGRRGLDLFGMYNCLGRFTITDSGEVYFSALGSRPTFSLDELFAQIRDAETALSTMRGAVRILQDNSP